MKWFWIAVCVPVLSAQFVPGKYIVELTGGPPAAVHFKDAVRAEQARLRPRMESLGARVVASIDLVGNALIVEMSDAGALRLARQPGVLRVTPVPLMHASLDHALPLLGVPDAWTILGGMSNAGAGIKIGIIDSGISPSHPGFLDDSLTTPTGFPIVGQFSDAGYTSGKIIVVRTYAPNSNARDTLGHGTAVAMAAAGVTNTGPLATITGVAPKAWLGIYKVNDELTFDGSLLLQAMNDAVADGMDIINISAGITASAAVERDPFVAAVERASALGVVVVLAAGNEGPGSTTIDSPASAPSAIAVGASENDRMFAQAMVLLDGATSYAAQPGNGPKPAGAIAAPAADVAALDVTGEACAPLPPNSLAGQIALILRSGRSGATCFFEDKLNHAQAAGAVAAIVYMNADSPDIVTMDVRQATLPAVAVDNASGSEIKTRLQAGPAAFTIQFGTSPISRNSKVMAPFSSRGPNVDLAIKPDVLAIGDNLYTATQKVNPGSVLYDASGYLTDAPGTSFSTPLVAGAVAMIKSARPGLTAAQYRSLAVNSATPLTAIDGSPLPVQWTGAGLLNAGAALRNNVAVSPVSLSFGAGAAAVNLARPLTVMNVGDAEDTFTLSLAPATGVAPALDTDTVRLGAGGSLTLTVHLNLPAAAASVSQGYLHIRGTRTDVDTVVPYWYAVSDQTPAEIPILSAPGAGAPGSAQRIVFRVLDANGVPLSSIAPALKVLSGSGTAQTVSSGEISFTALVRLGLAGSNVFEIDAGAASVQVTIQAQ